MKLNDSSSTLLTRFETSLGSVSGECSFYCVNCFNNFVQANLSRSAADWVCDRLWNIVYGLDRLVPLTVIFGLECLVDTITKVKIISV